MQLTAEPKDTLARLQRQNSCVKDVSKWHLYSARPLKSEQSGTLLTLGIPKENIDALREAKGVLFCGLGRAKVTIHGAASESTTSTGT